MSEAKKPATPAKRRDPEARHIEGVTQGQVRNRDPNKHYVAVSKSSTVQGTEYYEDMGYDFVRKDEPERFAGSRENSDSDVVEYQGHVLMSISRERFLQIREKGAYGTTGQAWANKLEKRIIDRASAQTDALRGIHRSPGGNPYLRVESTISPAVQQEGRRPAAPAEGIDI